MNWKRFTETLICFTVISVNQQPALADDTEPSATLRGVNQSAAPPTSTSLPATQTDPSSQGNSSQNSSSKEKEPSALKKPFTPGRLPVYLAGIATGAFVGMPINLVRRFFWEEKNGIEGLCGQSKNKVAVVSAGTFWLPFSALLGACEAPVMGPVNSLKNYDKPFSKDQFSLGKLGDGSGRDPE